MKNGHTLVCTILFIALANLWTPATSAPESKECYSGVMSNEYKNTITFCYGPNQSTVIYVYYPNTKDKSPPANCMSRAQYEKEEQQVSVNGELGSCDNGRILAAYFFKCVPGSESMECEYTSQGSNETPNPIKMQRQ